MSLEFRPFSRCEYALYDSVGQLDRTLTNLSDAIGECRDDLEKNEAEVSGRGNFGRKETGLMK